jgi:hypothetical protein
LIFGLCFAFCLVGVVKRDGLRQRILQPENAALLRGSTRTRRARLLRDGLRKTKALTFRNTPYKVINCFFIAFHADTLGILFCGAAIYCFGNARNTSQKRRSSIGFHAHLKTFLQVSFVRAVGSADYCSRKLWVLDGSSTHCFKSFPQIAKQSRKKVCLWKPSYWVNRQFHST